MVQPKNTPPRREWHPQVSMWSASTTPSRVFTRGENRTLAKRRRVVACRQRTPPQEEVCRRGGARRPPPQKHLSMPRRDRDGHATSRKRASHTSHNRHAPAWACATTSQPRRTVRCCATTMSLVMAQGWASALRLSAVGAGLPSRT
jgi:hypothetical protein